jgi:DNA-binding response OmpR family regulator
MSSKTVRSKRVVVVDCNGHGGLVLERALGNHGWSVTRVAGGRALAAASAQDHDAVLVVLDDHDGDVLDMLIRLSCLPAGPPIVMLSRRAGDAGALAELGVARVLAWPCHVDRIVAALEALLPSDAGRRVS